MILLLLAPFDFLLAFLAEILIVVVLASDVGVIVDVEQVRRFLSRLETPRCFSLD
jgi:hypothetical protein